MITFIKYQNNSGKVCPILEFDDHDKWTIAGGVGSAS